MYFYYPEQNHVQVFDGTIHLNGSTNTCFKNSQNSSKNESFLLESSEFYINPNIATSSFEVEIFSNVVFKYLQQSQHPECKSIFIEFQHLFLQDTLAKPNSLSRTTKNKL